MRSNTSKANVGWIHIVDTESPLLHGQPDLLGARRDGVLSRAARSPVDKSTSVRRVFEDLQDGRNGGFLPDHVAFAIPSRYAQIMSVEETQDFACRSQAQKRRKDQAQAVLDLLIGILVDAIKGITDKPHRERERELTPLRFVVASRRHAGTTYMQFQRR